VDSTLSTNDENPLSPSFTDLRAICDLPLATLLDSARSFRGGELVGEALVRLCEEGGIWLCSSYHDFTFQFEAVVTIWDFWNSLTSENIHIQVSLYGTDLQDCKHRASSSISIVSASAKEGYQT
jgi:hypothetical protein